jgi:hypothetical protein
MMHSSEQEVTQALEVFLDTITRLAHRAALEAVRLAFVSNHRHGRGAAPPGAAERRAAIAAEMDRVVAYLREHPGSSARQLALHLSLDASKIRRLLRRLVANALIHTEEAERTRRQIGSHGRTYTAVAAHGTPVGTQPKSTPVMEPEHAHTMEPEHAHTMAPEQGHTTPLEPSHMIAAAEYGHAMPAAEPAPPVVPDPEPTCVVPPERPVKLSRRTAKLSRRTAVRAVVV